MIEKVIANRIGIELTTRCCNKCIMCPKSLPNYNDLRLNQGYMSLDTLNIILDKIQVNYKNIEVSFCQDGDASLYPYLKEAFNMVHERKFDLSMTTNGYLLNKDMMDFLLNFPGKIRFCFDLYGPDQESYKRISGIDGFNKVLSNLTYLANNKKNGLQLETGYIRQLLNVEEENRLINIFNSLKIPFTYANLHPYPRLNLQKYDKIFKGKKPPCVQPFSQVNINFDGTMGPCCLNYGTYSCGSVLEHSIDEVFFGDIFNSLRIKHLNGDSLEGLPCEYCDIPYVQPVGGWSRWFKR